MRHCRLIGFALLLLFAFGSAAQADFAFRKPLTLDGTQVQGGPHLDFPVLVSLVDPNLRTVASGGGVQSAQGFDIAFRAGYGEAGPEGLAAFLRFAYHSWKRPSPRYVVLLGDSTYDPKDFLQTHVADRVPFHPVATSYLWTASDAAYAAVNGSDLLPDLALGRLPAASVAEAEAMVAKVVAFESAGRTLDGPAVLVADNADSGGAFEREADEVAAGVLAGRPVRKVYVRDLGAATRPEIVDALDAGASFLSYVGHGGTAVWASENVFNSSDPAALQAQAQQPLLLTLNCLNGFFYFPLSIAWRRRS